MGVSLAITNASIAECEKGVDVAATLKRYFGMFLQPALNKMDGTKKRGSSLFSVEWNTILSTTTAVGLLQS
jgi:hypothetical protein